MRFWWATALLFPWTAVLLPRVDSLPVICDNTRRRLALGKVNFLLESRGSTASLEFEECMETKYQLAVYASNHIYHVATPMEMDGGKNGINDEAAPTFLEREAGDGDGNGNGNGDDSPGVDGIGRKVCPAIVFHGGEDGINLGEAVVRIPGGLGDDDEAEDTESVIYEALDEVASGAVFDDDHLKLGVFTLRELFNAFTAMDDKSHLFDYNIVHNNCATLILSMMRHLELPADEEVVAYISRKLHEHGGTIQALRASEHAVEVLPEGTTYSNMDNDDHGFVRHLVEYYIQEHDQRHKRRNLQGGGPSCADSLPCPDLDRSQFAFNRLTKCEGDVPIDCGDIQDLLLALTPDNDQCTMVQDLANVYCGCPAPQDLQCPLCKDGLSSQAANLDAAVWAPNQDHFVRCSNLIYLNPGKESDQHQCAAVQMFGVAVCGCPVPDVEEEKQCKLCVEEGIPFGKKEIFPALSCDNIQRWALSVAQDGDPGCETIRAVLGPYCGCQNEQDNEDVCRICKNGELLPEPGRSSGLTRRNPACAQLEYNGNLPGGSCRVTKDVEKICCAKEAPDRVADPQDTCRARDPTSAEKTLMFIVDEQSTEQRHRRDLAADSFNISVYFHALAKEDSDLGKLKEKHVDMLMSTLQQAFEPTPFEFSCIGTTLSRNDTWHKCRDKENFQQRLRVGGRDTLNVYVCDSRRNTIVKTSGKMKRRPFVGEATYPHELNSLDGGLVSDGMVLRNPAKCFRRKLKKAKKVSKLDVAMSFVHETGHWMGLLHTFEGGCSNTFVQNDFVNGAVGDGVIDTAAELVPAFEQAGWRECFKFRPAPDTCPDDIPGVDPGLDPVNNFMDYAHSKCLSENGHFTQGQVARMEAQFLTYRHSGGPQTRRKLRSLASSVPIDELMAVSLASTVKECKCELKCYYRFRDLLRDFLPLHELSLLLTEAFEACSACPQVGADGDCGDDLNQYCEYGDTIFLGNRCVAKMMSGRNSHCWTNVQCLSGYCGPMGLCVDCPVLGSSEGCGSDKYCGLVETDEFIDETVLFGCLPKLGNGERCFSSDSCDSGRCTGGICSECGFSGEGCPSRKACHLVKKSGRRQYVCTNGPDPKVALLCSSDSDCSSLEAAQCIDGVCKECSKAGESDGCDQATQYCSAGFQCRSKIETANLFAEPDPCWHDDMCTSGHCVGGECKQCPVVGTSIGCAFDEVCTDYECRRKLGESEQCLVDQQCRSNDCRKGRCYGECADDRSCGIGGTCLNQFCVVRGLSGTKQRYFNTYDCRLGSSFQRCFECAANWQCEEEEFCGSDGLCSIKRVDGNCNEDYMCVSSKCLASGKCDLGSVGCSNDSNCDEQEYCGGFECKAKRNLGDFCTEHSSCSSGACSVASQKCEECSDDSACAADSYCFFGSCLKKACESASDCPSDQVCKPQGVFGSWSCVGCYDDAHCHDNKRPGCDLNSNICVECSSNSHCDSDRFCSGNICVKKKCTEHADCEFDGNISSLSFGVVCERDRKWDCVRCIKDDDCSGKGTVCDKNNQCQACLQDDDCPEDHQFCKIGELLNSCAEWECTSDADCRGDLRCNEQVARCSQCTKDRHCHESEACFIDGNCHPKGCESNADCEGAVSKYRFRNSTTPICDTVMIWECVECATDQDCADVSRPVCNSALRFGTSDVSVLVPGFCYECLTNTDCLFTEFCQGGKCKERECVSHSDCSGSKVCSFNDDGNPDLGNEFQCVECVTNEHCLGKGPKNSVCVDNICRECQVNADCPGIQQCQYKSTLTDGPVCVLPPCLRDSDCSFFCLIRQETGVNECF